MALRLALALLVAALCTAPRGAGADQLAPALSAADAAAALALPPDVLPGSAEGLEAVLGALTARGASDARLAAAALSLLARTFDAEALAAGADATPAFVTAALAADALPALVAAMRAHVPDAGVGGAGCAALVALGRHSVAHKPAGDAAAVEAAVAALRAHDADASIAAVCTNALMNLVVAGPNKPRVASSGLPAAVVAVMKLHADDVLVSRQGCGALNNAAAGHSGNKAAVAAAGGVEALVAVLQAHRRDAAAVEQACGALAVLGTGDGLAVPAAQAGAVVAAAAALEAHLGVKKPKKGSGRAPRPPSPRVAASCARAIASLAWSDEGVQRTAREALAPELLRAAQERMGDDEQVKKWTAKALEKITDPMIESMFEGMLSGFGPEGGIM
jgi:hypothetical protein